MKTSKYFFLLFFLIINCVYAQNNKINEKDNRIHVLVSEKAKPENITLSNWNDVVMNEMKTNWNLSFVEVVLNFVIEKDGSISNLKINSEEWKPDVKVTDELTEILNKQQKWIPAIHGGYAVRSTIVTKYTFQR